MNEWWRWYILWLVLDAISSVTWLIYRSHRRESHGSKFLTAVTYSSQSNSKLYVQKNNYVPNCPVELAQWHHNERDGVSNHQPHDCLLNCLFRRRSKKTSKLRVTAFVRGIQRWPVNSPHKGPVTREIFPFDDVIMVGHSWRESTKPVGGMVVRSFDVLLWAWTNYWMNNLVTSDLRLHDAHVTIWHMND